MSSIQSWSIPSLLPCRVCRVGLFMWIPLNSSYGGLDPREKLWLTYLHYLWRSDRVLSFGHSQSLAKVTSPTHGVKGSNLILP